MLWLASGLGYLNRSGESQVQSETGSPALWSSSLMGGPGVGPMERHLTTPDASCVRTIWICEVLPGVRGMQVKRARKRWIHGERCSQSCPKKESYMKRSLASRKMEIAPFSVERKRCQPLRLRHGRLVNRMLPFVMWTELKGENRPIRCFHLSFHPSFHPAPSAKYPHRRPLARVSEAFGDGRGDGERAVATPLFDGKCRPGALRVPRASRLLQGVATAPSRPWLPMSRYYTSNTARTSEFKNPALPR